MNGPVPLDEFDRLERFFHSRGCACVLDVCPLADFSVIEQVMQRAYKIVELNNVLVRRLSPEDAGLEDLPPIEEDRKPEWVRTVACGFAGSDDPPPELESLLGMSWHETNCFLTHGSGAALGIRDNTALFFGDATVIRERGKGGQSRLIRARIAHASRMGCDLAVASVLPGTGSHRNYERAGFQLVYMRVNVSR
jgi:GNAT superfamily N-acetyltransferase